MQSIKNNLGLIVVCGAMLATAFLIFISAHTSPVLGSTTQGSEYQGTTTVSNHFNPEQLLLTGSGTLGSVTITGGAAGVINFYDATTSSILLREARFSSSTILLASFPANAATSTYTFDRVVFNGLYVSIVGTMPTTTITFR